SRSKSMRFRTGGCPQPLLQVAPISRLYAQQAVRYLSQRGRTQGPTYEPVTLCITTYSNLLSGSVYNL
ncbi:MAG: hypothetical protein ACE5K8_07735, partial [Candidatus Zixiibacteriota bacterium]